MHAITYIMSTVSLQITNIFLAIYSGKGPAITLNSQC
jgi:hypothetical protein